MEWEPITTETVLPEGAKVFIWQTSFKLFNNHLAGVVTGPDTVYAEEHTFYLSELTHYCLVSEPTADHTAAYHALQESIFMPAILSKALPPITGDLTTGKLEWRGVYLWHEEVSEHVERSWIQQRETVISPVIEFDLSTGEYKLID